MREVFRNEQLTFRRTLDQRNRALPDGQGRTRTYGVSDVTDLQSAAIAAMLTYPNAFPVTEKLPETDETKCEPSTSGTQNGDRHCR